MKKFKDCEKRFPDVKKFVVLSERYNKDGTILYQEIVGITKNYIKALGIAHQEIYACMQLTLNGIEKTDSYHIDQAIPISKSYNDNRDGMIIKYSYIYNKEKCEDAVKILFFDKDNYAFQNDFMA